MNRNNYMLFTLISLVSIILIIVILNFNFQNSRTNTINQVKENFYFQENNNDASSDKCLNDYKTFDKKTGLHTSTLVNICNYKLLTNPADPNKLMTMLQTSDDNSQFTLLRPKNDIEKDYTLGFYINPDSEDNHYKDSKDLIFGVSKDDKIAFTMSIINTPDKELKYNLYVSFEGNTLEIPFSNNEDLTYIVIKMRFKTEEFIPEVHINVNNRNTIVKLKNKQTQTLSLKKFILGNGFKGYIGNIQLFDKIIDNQKFCEYFNCNLVCFEPSEHNSYGGNVNGCIKDCMNSCNDIKKCQNICVNCEVEGKYWTDQEKKHKCAWLSEIKIQDMTIPDSPTIRGYPGDGSILIEWKTPFDGRSKISNYIIMYQESFNKKKGLQVSIANNPENEIYEHEITNLKNKTNYDITIRAVNSKGIGKPSNILTIAPNGNLSENINENIFKELEDNINAKVRNLRDSVICDSNDYESVGHTLDYYDVDDFDMKSYIHKLKKNNEIKN